MREIILTRLDGSRSATRKHAARREKALMTGREREGDVKNAFNKIRTTAVQKAKRDQKISTSAFVGLEVRKCDVIHIHSS